MAKRPQDDLDEGEVRDLMVRYQAADAAAVEALVGRLSPTLRRYLSAAPANNEVEDMLQDFWLRLHRSRHTYNPSKPVLPWIFAIAGHTRVDAYRRRWRLLSREVTFATIPEHLSQTEQPEFNEYLRILDLLPNRQREVILMLKLSGMSLEEVAKATAASIGAIKQRAHRAYDKLRGILGNDVYLGTRDRGGQRQRTLVSRTPPRSGAQAAKSI